MFKHKIHIPDDKILDAFKKELLLIEICNTLRPKNAAKFRKLLSSSLIKSNKTEKFFSYQNFCGKLRKKNQNKSWCMHFEEHAKRSRNFDTVINYR